MRINLKVNDMKLRLHTITFKKKFRNDHMDANKFGKGPIYEYKIKYILN